MKIKIVTIILVIIYAKAYSQIYPVETTTDLWTGKVYKGKTISKNYVGYYTEPEVFEQDFGNGDIFEFNGTYVKTKRFQIVYEMITSRNGCYICDIFSDNYALLHVDGKYTIDPNTFININSFTHLLINLSKNSKLKLTYKHNSKDHFIKFLNLKKLNTIVKNKTQTICSGNKPNDIDGDKPPKKLTTTNDNTYNFKILAKYKWETKNAKGEWIEAQGRNDRFFYSPPALTNYSNQDKVYYYRRIATYTQQLHYDDIRIYNDNTAIAKVIVKPCPTGYLTTDRFYCEGDNELKVNFIANIAEEKYDIIINDGNKDMEFKNIMSEESLKLNFSEEHIKRLKIVSITNTSTHCSNNYNKGKEPSISILKHKKIITNRIQRVKK